MLQREARVSVNRTGPESVNKENVMQLMMIRQPSEFQPLPVNLLSAARMRASTRGCRGARIMFALEIKSPDTETTFSR